MRTRDREPQLVARAGWDERLESGDPLAIDADRRERVTQELLCVKQRPAFAEVAPSLDHEIDELLDLAPAAMLARHR